ncbi:hypothetical protein CPB84DRAFT_1849656 [Gymnopilus junonius]|uniref:Uncharacterized protein n=1 Tax=Gymnopilus junonius TaxID=109634 RepID=A0A9P5NK72_GYMJU|nr:hypothetical protein CPB84DRAFT_1849656 [Gymnopilus junonius]
MDDASSLLTAQPTKYALQLARDTEISQYIRSDKDYEDAEDREGIRESLGLLTNPPEDVDLDWGSSCSGPNLTSAEDDMEAMDARANLFSAVAVFLYGKWLTYVVIGASKAKLLGETQGCQSNKVIGLTVTYLAMTFITTFTTTFATSTKLSASGLTI